MALAAYPRYQSKQPMTRLRLAAPLLSLLAVVVGCGGGKPVFHTDFDPTQDFSGYQTYGWMQRAQTGDSRVDDNQVLDDAVHRFVDRELQAKGYRLVGADVVPDFYVGYYVTVGRSMKVDEMNARYGYGDSNGYWSPYYVSGAPSAAGPSRTYMELQNEARFALDIMDGHSRRLVWRALGQGEVRFYDEGTDESPGRVEEIIHAVLADFPPH